MIASVADDRRPRAEMARPRLEAPHRVQHPEGHLGRLAQDDPAPAVAPGVLAILDGTRDGYETDEERLANGSVVCEAPYTYCRQTSEAESEL